MRLAMRSRGLVSLCQRRTGEQNYLKRILFFFGAAKIYYEWGLSHTLRINFVVGTPSLVAEVLRCLIGGRKEETKPITYIPHLTGKESK